MSRYRPYRSGGINPLWVIIGVTIVIFLADFISRQQNNSSLIIDTFGLKPAELGQHPWTVLTYIFIHADIWHILFNMLTLYFFGTFVITLVGETTFLITYFAGGIVGGLFYVLFVYLLHSNPYVPVIGASGAIFALGGLLMVMRPNVRVMTFPIPVPMPLWIAILIGFVLVMFISPNVAWQAHLGGLLYGAAVGYYFRRREYRRY